MSRPKYLILFVFSFILFFVISNFNSISYAQICVQSEKTYCCPPDYSCPWGRGCKILVAVECMPFYTNLPFPIDPTPEPFELYDPYPVITYANLRDIINPDPHPSPLLYYVIQNPYPYVVRPYVTTTDPYDYTFGDTAYSGPRPEPSYPIIQVIQGVSEMMFW